MYTAGSRFLAARSTRRLRSLMNMTLGNAARAPACARVISEKALSKSVFIGLFGFAAEFAAFGRGFAILFSDGVLYSYAFYVRLQSLRRRPPARDAGFQRAVRSRPAAVARVHGVRAASSRNASSSEPGCTGLPGDRLRQRSSPRR